MSEEILQALVHLFAIITKQNGGNHQEERKYLIDLFKKKLNSEVVGVYVSLYDSYLSHMEGSDGRNQPNENFPLEDSLQVLSICKKINKTLTHKQKLIVLIELIELIKAGQKNLSKKIFIVEAFSTGLNLESYEFNLIKNFILNEEPFPLSGDLSDSAFEPYKTVSLSPASSVTLYLLFIESVNQIFVKYTSEEKLLLNGQDLEKKVIQLFSPGSTLKNLKGFHFYYSDALALFRRSSKIPKVTFTMDDVCFHFSHKEIGLHPVSFNENAGKMIGIMGASGAGKTTLLNIMAGLQKPTSGKVLVNGINLYTGDENLKGVIGYISQEDLLIEELSVYQNLFFNAQLCFNNLSLQEIQKLVDKTLNNLGLSAIKHLQVGNIFNKKISGGQRKRLNIALEIIREPSILFVDEPTSGLSSRDSENVMDLLKELSLKGKLIYVVIHQPSSDIFKLFDQLILLDTGGYLIYQGEPVEVISYLKSISQRVEKEGGFCDNCGNVNPEQILNIVEEKLVDEFGNLTEKRKINPKEWHEQYLKQKKGISFEKATGKPFINLALPSKFKQCCIYIRRDFFTKINDSQYLLINFSVAPLLALILAFIVRYNNSKGMTEYLFRYNENLPSFIMMSILVALFVGLTGSAEEILKDKKILKRESFLHLSRSSYLFSKIVLLFFISGIQTFSFVLVGNTLLEIKEMYFEYWIVLFSISCMANIIGLNISSAFHSSVTIYILIPLLLIPQMILSGAIFSFDRVNETISNKEKVPLMADFMGSRWAFEALAVHQFQFNRYEKDFYSLEQVESISNYNLVYVIPILKSKLWFLERQNNNQLRETETIKANGLLLYNELMKQYYIHPEVDKNLLKQVKTGNLTNHELAALHHYIEQLRNIYTKVLNRCLVKKENQIHFIQKQNLDLTSIKDHYYNESLESLVRNMHSKVRILEKDNQLIPMVDFIYFNPPHQENVWNYRTQIFTPEKVIFHASIPTFTFNLLAIWVLSILFYALLYFEILKKIISKINTLRWH